MSIKMGYIALQGVPGYINIIVNEAISLCVNNKCSRLNKVHLLLAVLDTIENIDKKMEAVGCYYDAILESFDYKVSCDDYGTKDWKPGEIGASIINDDIADFISHMMSRISQATNGETIYMPVVALDILAEYPDRELDEFLDYIELDLDDLIEEIDGVLKKNAINNCDYLIDFDTLVENKNEIIENVDEYVDKMINVLCRKNKKNPCLVGESGVGKTTIVEALSKRIKSGNVPSYLKDKRIYQVNASALIGGTRFRGDFEQRVTELFEFAQDENIILFMDEIHQALMLGKNGDDGSGSLGNSLKNHLNEGTICLIGTTTDDEWHKYIESDSSLKRRLQDIKVYEPSIENTIKIVKNSSYNYSNYHNIEITDEAVEYAVKLSDKYMKADKFPDKAFKIIDQACATAKIERDKTGKSQSVNKRIINIVVSEITGIEIDKLTITDVEQLKKLESTIHQNLIGQNNAVNTVAKAVRRGKIGLKEKDKPIASLLFVGPTGVGKTELCKLVANEVFGRKDSFIRVDMSEFNDEASITKLIGSAPGYVGYGKGGGLTEKVKKNPYSLVLLDEIEKAHPKIFDTFLQVLDDGRLTDGEGQTIDFTNCIIVMTSNAGYGADSFNKKQLGFGLASDNKEMSYNEKEDIAKKALESTFKPEFLNRIDKVVIFEAITKDEAKEIAKLSFKKLKQRLADINIIARFSDNLIEHVSNLGYSEKYGARNINRTIQNEVDDVLTDAIIDGTMKENYIYIVDIKDGEITIEEMNYNTKKVEEGVTING